MAEELAKTLERLQADTDLAKGLIRKLLDDIDEPLTFMEVCGTHTHAISKTGIRRALADKVRLLSGPGCPVCVTADAEIDRFIELARMEDVVVTTFGDMLHVPGSETSLAAEKDQGRDIRIVYSPLDVMGMAEAEPAKEFCFLGVGFETTAPAILATVAEAKKRQIKNFSIYAAFKLIPPALRMIAAHPELSIHGFILPGHVSAIIGTEPYRFLVDKFKRPCVVAGFEGIDILQALVMVADQIQRENPRLDIQYKRVVTPEGNKAALKLMDNMCEKVASQWRGLDTIPATGLKLKSEWQDFDAERKINIPPVESKRTAASKGCRCGEVLLGKIIPPDCSLFARICTPSNPIGPCMVSSEGACSAYYKYER
jgi:hydrogenase expression/formation protein HypD